MTQKTALDLGAGGFIGGHLVKRLKREGFWVRGVDPSEAQTVCEALDAGRNLASGNLWAESIGWFDLHAAL